MAARRASRADGPERERPRGRAGSTLEATMMRQLLAAVVMLLLACAPAGAGDWPTYQHDPARSGVTDESPPPAGTMSQQWVYRAPAPPRPVWPEPQPSVERPKVRFDDALQCVAVGPSVYFGSSVDHQVYALDAATGRVRWRFFTGAAVRLAPTIDSGRVFVGSDDGKAYCLSADDGRLIWEHDAAPRPTRVIGGGRISSLWPVRTNLLVEGDRVYFGSGIFPSHNTALVVLDAATGTPIPLRDRGPKAWERLSPQGYLVRTPAGIVVPCGRSIPFVLDPQSGNPVHRLLSPDHRDAGGDYALTADGLLFYGTQNKLYAYDAQGGSAIPPWTSVQRLVASTDAYFVYTAPSLPGVRVRPGGVVPPTGVAAIDRAAQRPLLSKEAPTLADHVLWRHDRSDVRSMILAGDRLILGCKDEVVMLDARTGEPVWQARVEGEAAGLTFAHGRLLVSTTSGSIHCFAAGPAAVTATVPAPEGEPFAVAPAAVRALAEGVVRESGVRRGYALITGRGAAALACELARQTELALTAVEPDAAGLPELRRRVDAARLYGHRVSVEAQADGPWLYPDYAANLVVHLDAPDAAGAPRLAEESLRVLKPCGGVLLCAAPTAGGAEAGPDSALDRLWHKAGTLSGDARPVPDQAPWTRLVRGELEGSGWWTHAFADAGNTGSSGDQLVKDSLEILWYGEPGPGEATERHQRPMSPLVIDGRVFYQGWEFEGRRNTIQCFDAYNGLHYWKREMPGAVRVRMSAVSGNLACTADSLYVVTGSTCWRLDARTGQTLRRYDAPPGADGKARLWGYLAVAHGRLYGSATADIARPNAQELRSAEQLGTKDIGLRFSDALFAFDPDSGKPLWIHPAREIRDTTIAIGDGRIFFAENRGPTTVLPARSPDGGLYYRPPRRPDTAPGEPDVDRLGRPVGKTVIEPLVRSVVALDAATGKPAWEKEVDLAHVGLWGASASTRESSGYREIHALCKDDLLLFAAEFNRHGGRVAPDDLAQRKAIALSTRDGREIWARPVGNLTRPIILRDTLLAGLVLRELRTGEPLMKKDPKTGADVPWQVDHGGGCGTPSGCDAMVFYRFGGTGWRNLDDGVGGQFMGQRPGCFINIIPAGGIVVQPEASSGCTCSYGYAFSIQCTFAFRPAPTPAPARPGK